jgi:hypothetical protein
MLNREPVNCKAVLRLNKDKEKFKDMVKEDITIEDYPKELIKKKNPQVKLQLGI